MIRRPPRSTQRRHSFPTRRSSDLRRRVEERRGEQRDEGGAGERRRRVAEMRGEQRGEGGAGDRRRGRLWFLSSLRSVPVLQLFPQRGVLPLQLQNSTVTLIELALKHLTLVLLFEVLHAHTHTHTHTHHTYCKSLTVHMPKSSLKTLIYSHCFLSTQAKSNEPTKHLPNIKGGLLNTL